MKPNDEFYVGWEPKAPPGIGGRTRRTVWFLFALTVGLGLLLALAQGTIGVSVFEWGHLKEFTGILKSRPYPHLLALRPGSDGGASAFSSYYLVKPFKFGLDPEMVKRFDGHVVTLRGTCIYRENQTMIEALPESIKAAAHFDTNLTAAADAQPISLGRQTLIGEIVDSKCYLGVMNPGRYVAHRACAIRCISGGCPPIFLVGPPEGRRDYLLLVAADRSQVNQQVLDRVAEPLEITGEVERQGELLILRADPATYRRAVAGAVRDP